MMLRLDLTPKGITRTGTHRPVSGVEKTFTHRLVEVKQTMPHFYLHKFAVA